MFLLLFKDLEKFKVNELLKSRNVILILMLMPQNGIAHESVLDVIPESAREKSKKYLI